MDGKRFDRFARAVAAGGPNTTAPASRHAGGVVAPPAKKQPKQPNNPGRSRASSAVKSPAKGRVAPLGSKSSGLGKFVFERRTDKGLSQRALARAATEIGLANKGKWIDSNYIALLEQNRIKLPSQPYLEQIAAALDVDPGQLLKAAGYFKSDVAPINPFREGTAEYEVVEALRQQEDDALAKKMLAHCR